MLLEKQPAAVVMMSDNTRQINTAVTLPPLFFNPAKQWGWPKASFSQVRQREQIVLRKLQVFGVAAWMIDHRLAGVSKNASKTVLHLSQIFKQSEGTKIACFFETLKK